MPTRRTYRPESFAEHQEAIRQAREQANTLWGAAAAEKAEQVKARNQTPQEEANRELVEHYEAQLAELREELGQVRQEAGELLDFLREKQLGKKLDAWRQDRAAAQAPPEAVAVEESWQPEQRPGGPGAV